MKLKLAIIETMGRDGLKAVCTDLEIDGIDRRSCEDMAAAVSRARRVWPDALLEYLSEKQVKAVCDLVGVSACGRRGALIERLLDSSSGRVVRARPAAAAAESERRSSARPQTTDHRPQPKKTAR